MARRRSCETEAVTLRSLQKWHGAGNDFLVDVRASTARRRAGRADARPCALSTHDGRWRRRTARWRRSDAARRDDAL